MEIRQKSEHIFIKNSVNRNTIYSRAWQNIDNNNIFLFGESMGGLVTALAAEEYADEIKGMVLLYPAFCVADDWNKQFPNVDAILITKGEYWEIYDNQSEIANAVNTRKAFINLGVEDLKEEYDRIKELGIAAQLTPIRFIQVFSPYWYFTFMDPDGNPIEVTGGCQEE